MSNIFKRAGKAIFGGGSSTTYSPPNYDFLRESAPSVNYDFLRSAAERPAPASYDLLRQYASSSFNPGAGNLDMYRRTIGAPTGVDAVRGEVNSARLTNTLSDIERDTRQRFGAGIMDQYLKGLVGDGNNSDIAGNALAQIAASGGRTAADARTGMYGQELDRLEGRERSAVDAYLGERSADRGAGYSLLSQYAGLGANYAGMSNDLLARYAAGLESNAGLEMQRRLGLANALTSSATAQAQNTARDPGILRNVLDNVRVGFNFGGG